MSVENSEKIESNSKRDSNFSIGLGILFLIHHLLDAAEEAVSGIKKEDPQYKDARKLLLDIQFRRGNYPEVIRLAEQDLDREDIQGSVAEKVGAAYYHLGQWEAAKSYLLKGMVDFPENTEVIDKLRTLRPHGSAQPMDDLIQAMLQHFVPAHVALDCLAPVLSQGRGTSCCFEDQLFPDGLPTEGGLSPKDVYLNFAAALYERFGIFSAFLPFIQLTPDYCLSFKKIFFSQDRSVFDRVEEIRQASLKEFENLKEGSSLQLEYLEKEGRLLGYPDCCIEWMLHYRRKNQSPEVIALKALIEEEFKATVSSGSIPPPERAYFAFEFYPCSPRCQAAEKAGKRLLRQLKKANGRLAEVYQLHVIPFNKARMYVPETNYAEYAKPFNDRILHTFRIQPSGKTDQDFDLFRQEVMALLDGRPNLREYAPVFLITLEIVREQLLRQFQTSPEAQ